MHRAKKSLGQNFLKSEIALKKIIEAGEIKKGDIILEIGPGRGALTEKLLEKSGTVIAVEKDHELFAFLKIKFEKEITEKKLILINSDILDFNINLQKYKIIANIPYNITGAILKKFLAAENQPERMILMVQHEVAKRIIASDKKESILSISVKAYGEPKMIMKVNKRYFSPAPKVNSAIIAIKNISRKIFESEDELVDLAGRQVLSEERFWEIVKAGFAHKRKKLSSNLKNTGIFTTETLKNKRAEDLTLLDWISLSKS